MNNDKYVDTIMIDLDTIDIMIKNLTHDLERLEEIRRNIKECLYHIE